MKKKIKKLEGQGLCNEVYKINRNNKDLILRVFKKKHNISINRKQEFIIQQKAYEKTLASKPIHLDKKQTFMTCKYLKGIHKKSLSRKDIKVVAKALKKLHKIRHNKKPYSLKNEFKNYKKILTDASSKKLIKKSIKLLKNQNQNDLVLCHNDLNKQNMIFNKNRVFFIDWEFASINNRYFDLATICIKYNLNKKKEKILLNSYFTNVKQKYHKSIKNYKIICTNYWKLWFKANF